MTNPKGLDLGWANAGGETERAITLARMECRKLGHHPQKQDTGSYGTIHDIWCDECGYVYHEDSGD